MGIQLLVGDGRGVDAGVALGYTEGEGGGVAEKVAAGSGVTPVVGEDEGVGNGGDEGTGVGGARKDNMQRVTAACHIVGSLVA